MKYLEDEGQGYILSLTPGSILVHAHMLTKYKHVKWPSMHKDLTGGFQDCWKGTIGPVNEHCDSKMT